MGSRATPDDALRLWYGLGRLHAGTAGEEARRAALEGFVVALVAAAQVLLSAPFFSGPPGWGLSRP